MRAASAFVATAAVLAARPAAAQIEVETRISTRRIEENQPFQVQLRASTSGSAGRANNARLPAPPSIRVEAPSLSPETRVSIINGRMLQSAGVTATWTLVATKAGRYRIGPPSVELGGQRAQGEAIAIEVVPQGSAPRRPGGIPGRGFDPFDFFDPFRGSPLMPFPFDAPDAAPEPPEYPEEYAVDRARDPVAFLLAKAEPQRVVIGQAVRFSVYAYGGRGMFQLRSATEPSRAGFIAYAEDDLPRRAYEVPVADRTFIGRKIAELVLFPIQTGTLRVGPMRVGFAGPGYPAGTQGLGLMRESQPVDVLVTEPPVAGRPPGYRVGDVGRYTLSTTVDPRKIRQGEAVSVIAKLEGTGNVPSRLKLPQQNGVEWLDPSVTEKLEPVDGQLRGERTFTYVVKIERPGRVDLGELTLPFYDAERRRYAVARSTLGTIEVEPGPPRDPALPSAKAEPADTLRDVLTPPTALRPFQARGPELTDRPAFWWLLISGPLGVLTVSGAIRAGALLRTRFQKRRDTPAHRAQRELDAAKLAAANEDLPGTAAAVERAVHLGIEAATAIRSRGLLRGELLRTLTDRKVSAELAERLVGLLEAAEQARFTTAAAPGSALDLAARATTAVATLLRGARR